MKFSSIEQLQNQLAAQKNQAQSFEQEETKAVQALDAAKLAADALIATQLDTDEDLSGEIAKAEARVSVAVAKLQRVRQTREAVPTAKAVNLKSAKSLIEMELRSYISKGIQKDMDENIQALQQARATYLEAAEATLVQFFGLQKEFRQQIREASHLVGDSILEPVGFSPPLLREHGLFMNSDAQEIMHKIIVKADETVNGSLELPPPMPKDKQIVPALEVSKGKQTERLPDGTIRHQQTWITPGDSRKVGDLRNGVPGPTSNVSPAVQAALVAQSLGRIGK
jgi:hypothetical protein